MKQTTNHIKSYINKYIGRKKEVLEMREAMVKFVATLGEIEEHYYVMRASSITGVNVKYCDLPYNTNITCTLYLNTISASYKVSDIQIDKDTFSAAHRGADYKYIIGASVNDMMECILEGGYDINIRSKVGCGNVLALDRDPAYGSSSLWSSINLGSINRDKVVNDLMS